MTGLERMLTALRREEPDRVPLWELLIDRPVIEALYGDVSYEEFVEREGPDGITVFSSPEITPQDDIVRDFLTEDDISLVVFDCVVLHQIITWKRSDK